MSRALAILFGVLVGLFWGGEPARASVALETPVSIVRGEPQPASHVGLERSPGIVVASTPVLHRCAAVPAPRSGLTLARAFERRTSAMPPATTDATVVRWRTHVPRMNDGDPPRSARFAA